MSLGVRPKEEGGHQRINITLNAETHRGLRKIKKKGQASSKFIENAVGPLVRQLDPGDSCEALRDIDCFLQCRIASAATKRDFEKAAALTAVGNALNPFRSLCHPTKGDETRNAKLNGKSAPATPFLWEPSKTRHRQHSRYEG